ncbi:MAG: hypothetical protein C0412_16775, partial [Flavobacterium sp.]|nr:hypothetical protein [Flavobacterium sp.]
LDNDLNGSVKIIADNITLDCNGYKISGVVSPCGVDVRNRKGVVIKNCLINNHFDGIFLDSSQDIKIFNNKIFDNRTGISIYDSSDNQIIGNDIYDNEFLGLEVSCPTACSNNLIYHNNFIQNGITNGLKGQAYGGGELANNGYPSGGNYWSDYSGADEKKGIAQDEIGSDGIGDIPYTFGGGQDNYPWVEQGDWIAPQNQAPTISNLGQFKSDGLTEIAEGNITTESIVAFKSILSDSDGDQVKFQIEIKENVQQFNEQDIIESGFVSSGSIATTTKEGLINNKYKWRARAIDDKGNASEWQEFGIEGNVDFEVKLVPLYTQVRSPYPSDDDTKKWADEIYARGDVESYDCGSKIRQCGCAITSIVMIARYYDITETQGNDVNPKKINNWLKTEPGGYQNGDVNWVATTKYTNYKIKYEKTDKTINNYALLDEKLNNNQPVIAKEKSGRGGINLGHFIVIDNNSASTYSVKDPAWYNTKTLNETTNKANKIRGYENGFDGLRIYKKGNGIAQTAITFALGSPAELLITDSLGRKLGKDQNGIEYNEIPNAWYFEDGVDDPTEESPPSQDRNKLIQILEPLDGAYQLQVIGTGEGSYSLGSNFYDTQGNVNHQEIQSETAPSYTAQYDLSFNSSNSSSTTIKLFDEIPPEAEIYFDSNTQKLIIKGTDNTTVNPIVSVVNHKKEKVYQIKDEAGNTFRLTFENLWKHIHNFKELKKEFEEELRERCEDLDSWHFPVGIIRSELKFLQYNNGSIIKLPKTKIDYLWLIDKTGKIKKLNQKIDVKNQFSIKAKYNSRQNETEITTEKGKGREKQKTRQTLQGMVIIKLITKSGVLSFEY